MASTTAGWSALGFDSRAEHAMYASRCAPWVTALSQCNAVAASLTRGGVARSMTVMSFGSVAVIACRDSVE
ncbi:hypothetical protein ED92_39220 [Amycolatopsis sp. MJM2582]|nr:hypothetical protein ED92_39220 [Amycolatopsis sp. MJM2582]